MSMVGGVEAAERYREDSECLGHLVDVLDAVESLLANEPAKHFLTREPLNSAEEYAQAVGWQMVRRDEPVSKLAERLRLAGPMR